MKIETISVMQRKNLGNYEHIELSASAKVEEGEEALTAMMTLKAFVETALNAKVEEIKADKQEVETPPETPKKEKKTKAKKEEVKDTLESGQEIPPIIEEKKKKEKPLGIPYDRSIEAHKNTLSAFLSNNFPGWKASKPREEIIAFTGSLEGEMFLDNDGSIIASFEKKCRGFFGA